jgi:hypothetical protein
MRNRWSTTLLMSALAAAAGTIAFGLPASADLVTFCSGTASNVTVPNDLVVAAGRSCELTNVTINGNTAVRAGADLFLNNSTLNGNLVVQSNGFVNALDSTVTGTTRLNTAFGGYAENGSLGNVVAVDSGFFFSLGATLNNVTSTNGETYLESVRMNRLSTTGDLLTDVHNSVLRGTATVVGASLGSVFCASEIDGDAAVIGSGESAGAVVQIGSAAPLTGCAFNVFGGNLSLTGNLGPVFVSDNVIRGTLACTDNAVAPVGTSTRIRGGVTGQCAPAPPATAGAAAAAPADSRKTDLLARIKTRVDAGSGAAAAAGRADIPGNR